MSRSKQRSWIGLAIGSLGFWLFPTILTAIPAYSADRVAVFYGPLEFTLSVDALESFVKEGKITDELAPYAGSIKPESQAQLREILQQRFEANPTLISQFTSAQLGKTVLERMGKVLLTETGENGATALRAALISAAGDPQGLSLLNLVRKFPDRTIRVNLNLGLQITAQFSEFTKYRDAIVKVIEQQAATEAETAAKVDFSQQPDLRKAGSFQWEQQTITLNDTVRDRTLTFDLYLPQANDRVSVQQPAPVIVISHGAAGNRSSFAYLAQHLASHGFAVAAIDHPGDNTKLFEQFFSGLTGSPQPIELVNRSLEITFVLDELERRAQSDPTLKGRLNLQQVGAIGQSLGGYTSLALAGAKLNFPQLQKDCNNDQFLNLSLLVQCDVARLPNSNYTLQDERIKAVFAINPLTSSVFGQSGLSQIKVPVMLVAGTDDIFTPAVTEQIQPFTWLTTPEKYLVLLENATHFTTIAKSRDERSVLPIPPELVGPDPALARPYINALSTAFFKNYLTNASEYRAYLSPAYTRSITQEPFKLILVQSLTATQINRAIESVTPKQASQP
ncbi:alpha/beta hydrolase [Aerosakkonema funiforme]|uniref:Alpha/beta hydrolase n=1 Tax=Aerosakkonema funiforme FACHB-1375 TaxID=2949571 RepID=A0A926VIL0_9CYAN|nr:alpha/beta hydrolase [Aerosakkonema funiforme]MBD2184472.1 alpha/beta hydrolase [Aerosakkonema funiforme FACHB-1375]